MSDIFCSMELSIVTNRIQNQSAPGADTPYGVLGSTPGCGLTCEAN